jgi:amidase
MEIPSKKYAFPLVFASTLMLWLVLTPISEAQNETFMIEEATIAGIHAAMKGGELTAQRLVRMYLARIEAYDQTGPSLNAVILVNPDAATRAAELDLRLEQSGLAGTLHGIPIFLKDNVDTDDMPTTGGSLSLEGSIPLDDAFIVKRLREAGAIVLAKVNLHELATRGVTRSSLRGQTLNPYDLSRTPGGSSGGTGAAVAANFGVMGIGTDTVNSIRSPASANSLVGIRPTLGLVSRGGIIPVSSTQVTAGPIARTVEDAAKMLDAIAGYDPDDLVTARSVGHTVRLAGFLDKEGLNGARVGVLESFFGAGPEHEAVNRAVRGAIETMEEMGAIAVSIDEPINPDALVAELSVHAHEYQDLLDGYLSALGPEAPVGSLEQIVRSGRHDPSIAGFFESALTSADDVVGYQERLAGRTRLQDMVLGIMAAHRLDALVFPHQRRLTVPIGDDQVERNGILGAATGFPSIVVPAGFSSPAGSAPIGVPIGIEFLGRPWAESTLVELAYAFEQATKYRRPPESVPPLSPR